MNKLLVYPVDKEFVPLLRHNSLFSKYSITKLVAPKGWGLTGKNGDIITGNSKLSIEFDFDKALESCDTVLFVDSIHNADFKSLILPKLVVAGSKGKKIIYTRNLLEEDQEEISKQRCLQGNKIKYLSNECTEIKMITQKSIFSIDTPVVFVMGTAQQSDKFEIQLMLREKLLKMGYKISQIGSRSCSTLFGFHSIPSFMLNHDYNESDKILLFNHYVKKIELEEKPELIIVGFPGGVLPFSNKFTNDFGIVAYEIAQAIKPDFVILSSLYEDYEDDYFDAISNGIEKRFGFSIDSHNLSCTKVDWLASEASGYLTYLTTNTSIVDKKIESVRAKGYSIYNTLRHDDGQKLAQEIIDKLSEYAYAKSV